MLDIANLIWVVPGIAGLLTYNQRLTLKYRQAEGWRYLSLIIFFATPYYFVDLIPLIGPWFTELDSKAADLLRMISSIILSILLGALAAYIHSRYFNNPKSSPFHDCCSLWKDQFVFITLTNRKVYLAQLLDYTKDLRSEAAIRVEPFSSGYRKGNGTVKWTFAYPVEQIALNRKTEGIEDPGLIIPYKEMVTFSLWDSSDIFTDAPQVKKPKTKYDDKKNT